MNAPQPTTPFPVGTNPRKERVADWVELVALATALPFKRGDLKSALSREDIANPDMLEELTWAELSSRSKVCGSVWPFRLEDAILVPRRPRGVSIQFYRFLAMLGLGEGVTNGDRRIFEEAFAELMEPITGSRAGRFGDPPGEGQPKSFGDRFEGFLVDAGSSVEERGRDPLPTDKDLGLDAAAAQSLFRDNRGGATIHYWAQCSTGYDWEDKLSDLDFEIWRPHFIWSVPPIKIMATPLVLSLPESKWHRVVRKGGLVVDRPRLLELARQASLPAAMLRTMSARSREISAA